MSADIPAIVKRLKARRRVIVRARDIEGVMNENLRSEFFNGLDAIDQEIDEINRLRRVRFR